MYIWDPVEMGEVAAFVSMGLWSGDIEELPGEESFWTMAGHTG